MDTVRSFPVRASVLAMAVAASLGACTSQPDDAAKPAASNSPSSPATPAAGSDASAILDTALSSAQPLARGAGPLETSIGNTMARTPSAGSVSFVFACTGTGKVALRFRDKGREIASARGEHTCGGTVFERSLPVTGSSIVSFDGSVQDPTDGKFAYAYLQEKAAVPSPTSSS